MCCLALVSLEAKVNAVRPALICLTVRIHFENKISEVLQSSILAKVSLNDANYV